MNIESPLVRVAVYLRVSTVGQLCGYGVDIQLGECLAWLDFAVGNGRYSYDVYTDGAVSGKLTRRPDLTELDADLVQCLYDVVVFGKLDRIGRTMREIHRWVYDTTDIETSRGRRVRVATADGRIDSEHPMFGIQLSLLAYVAELEHALLLERTLRGREMKLAAGGWPGGVAPFWLMLPARGDCEAPTLRAQGVELLDVGAWLIADERFSAAAAAENLNALGYVTARGLPWTGENLARVFQQTALDGYVAFRFARHRGVGHDREEGDGTPVPEEAVRITVPIPLPAGRVRQVRAALARRSYARKEQRTYLLSGRVTSLCGHHYIGAHREDRGRTAYRCTGRRSDPPCSCGEIVAGPLEDAVWREVAKFLVDRVQLRVVAEGLLGVVPGQERSLGERLVDLDTRIERCRQVRKKKLVALAGAVTAGGGEDSSFVQELRAALAEVGDDFADKDRRLGQLREVVAGRVAAAQRQEIRARRVLEGGVDVQRRLDLLDVEQRLELLDLLGVEVRTVTKVPGAVRAAGCLFEAWFNERQRAVPRPLTDDQWAALASCFPVPRKRSRVVPPRVAFEAALYKVRHGIRWDALPVGVLQGQRPQGVYQRALGYLKDGYWQRAVDALGDYEGTAVPPLYVLPDIDITCTFDASLMAHWGHSGSS
ncbi:recombinase family protein [Streptomyces sp. NBC_00503]|uniref:recombinase family protein n=1 Tax=Streptomyces sp. NBC_00503 TaxID=2903659 RepID=UPI002E7FCEC6|nr:recombinase family protein [Streptomyces sp. NBC_00503]WUD84452.1 recombinase family protein [Streptomyces sp. NBC_00503]